MSDSPFRGLPSVHEVLERLDPISRTLPHKLVTGEIRKVLASAREHIRAGEVTGDLIAEVQASLTRAKTPSLRGVINATGVVLHTNLGRAPLPAFDPIPGYSNLEYDLATGKRGKRDTHTGELLEAILGAPAIIVNNGAAALLLVLNELAQGGEVIVSRGELIEIGDGFRIPEIMEKSGAILRETGTTNRTTIADYRKAINDRTRVLLRVHPSNFRMTGFTARPDWSELAALGREKNIPVYEDLGSGCIVDLRQYGIAEPLAQESLAAGMDLVTFSGDKLLGGPQAGIIAGRVDLIQRVRRNPLFRVLRQDKLFYQAMEETLRHTLLENWGQLPALRMIRMTAEEIRGRAEALAAKLSLDVKIEPGESVIGGGSTPDKSLPTYLLVIENKNAAAFEKRLRAGNPPVIARIENNRVLLDLRTVFPEQEDQLVYALSW